MDANVYPSPLHDAVREDGPPLEMLLLYEDYPTALRAKQLLDRLAISPRLQPFAPLKEHILRLDVLRFSLLEDTASDWAAKADVVIVSLHGDTELSPHFQRWLRQWHGRPDREPLALVVLLDEQARGSLAGQRILSFLRKVAEDAQLDFFCDYGGFPASADREAGAAIPDQARKTSPVPEGSIHRPEQFRGWGINE